jgi:arylsulfatase A-like enzyme
MLVRVLPFVLLVACNGVGDDAGARPHPAGDDTSDSGEPVVITPGFAGLGELGVKNVIVVHVDTLRADHLPMYGSEHQTLPQISELPWMVVDDVYAPTSWTIPSTISVLTELDVTSHGIFHMNAEGEMNAPFTFDTVAKAFGDQGYRTVMMSGNLALPEVDGIFADFQDVDPELDGNFATSLGWEVTNTLAWVDTLDADQPFFAFLQPMNAHQAYHPPDEYLGTWSDAANLPFSVDPSVDETTQFTEFLDAYEAAPTDEARAALVEQFRDVYDEDILGVDDALAKLVHGIASRGLDEETLIVVAGDHGETLGEELSPNGRVFFGHGGKVREELVHVPLLFYNPRLPAQTVGCLAANFDLMPTVLSAVGLPPLPDADGRALQDGCRDYVHATTWIANTDADTLKEALTTDGDSALRWSCDFNAVYRYDLTADPTGIATVDEAAFPAGPALVTEMRSFLDTVSETLAPVSCYLE